jgi:hypothetical protein
MKVPGWFQPLNLKCDLPVSKFAFTLTHSLKAPWFQPLNLKCDLLVAKFSFFKFNLYRYSVEADAIGAAHPLDGGEDNDEDGGVSLLQERARVAAAMKKASESTGPSAESQLVVDLEGTRDALLIMGDEDESRAAIDTAAAGAHDPSRSRLGPTGGARSGARPLTEYEQATRKVRRHALEVRAECLASLVEGVERRRMLAQLQHEKNDCEVRADTSCFPVYP